MILFECAIKSKATKRHYSYLLNRFLGWYKIKYHDALLSINPKKLCTMIEDYVIDHKQRVGRSWLNGTISALELFLSQNDIVLNWKKLKRMLPPRELPSGRHPYETKDIKALLQYTDSIRTKALIHFMASTGVRVGAMPGIRLGHIVPMDSCCLGVRIYAGTKDEYWSFLTPEASAAFADYIKSRERAIIHSTDPQSQRVSFGSGYFSGRFS